MKNYIYYIIAAIAAYLLFFRKKANAPAPQPAPAPAPTPTPQPAPPNGGGGNNIMPGFPSGCPYTHADACEKWKLEQEQDNIPPISISPIHEQKPPIHEQKLPIHELKVPIHEQKPPIVIDPGYNRPPVSTSPSIPTESEIANKAAAERAQQERLKAEAWQRELAEQQKKAQAAGRSTLIREELSPKTAVALKNTLKASAWDRIAY